MTTFNTGNPIGSTDARDRSDNSENLDLAVNSLALTFEDRLGVTRDTLEGIYQKSAYYRAGTFDAGYTLTNNRQTLAYGNIEYSWSGAFPKVVSAGSTPETTGGIGAGAWVDRSGDILKQDLASPIGTSLVSDGLFNATVKDIVAGVAGKYNSVADLINASQLTIGCRVSTLSYYSGIGLGGNTYQIVPAGTGVADNGSFINLNNGLQAKALFLCGKNAYQFGAKDNSPEFDSGPAIQAFLNTFTENETIHLDGRFYASPLSHNKKGALVGCGFIQAFADQTHIFKLYGASNADPLTHFTWDGRMKLLGGLHNISDAGLVLEHVQIPYFYKLHVEFVFGWGVRLTDVFEPRFLYPFIRKVGGPSTGGLLIDNAFGGNALYNVNNIRIEGGTWGHINGPHIKSLAASNLDLCWIKDNKFEWDGGFPDAGPHTNAQAVIDLDNCSRVEISGNGFTNYSQDNTAGDNGFTSLIHIRNSASGVINIGKNTAQNCNCIYGINAEGGLVHVDANFSRNYILPNIYLSVHRCTGAPSWVSFTSNGGYSSQNLGKIDSLTFGATDLTQTTKNSFVNDSDAYTQTRQTVSTTFTSADVIVGDLYDLNAVKSIPLPDATTVTISVRVKEEVDGCVVRLVELNTNLTPTATVGQWQWLSTTTTLGVIRGVSRIRILHQNAGSLRFDCIGFNV